MSEDEAIKILNDYLCKIHTKFSSIGAIGIPDKEYFAIETILDLYQKKKEKIEAMNKGIDELTREKQDLKTELYMNSVSKDKIKAKIKELEEKPWLFNNDATLLKILKELLEE